MNVTHQKDGDVGHSKAEEKEVGGGPHGDILGNDEADHDVAEGAGETHDDVEDGEGPEDRGVQPLGPETYLQEGQLQVAVRAGGGGGAQCISMSTISQIFNGKGSGFKH